MWICPRTRSVSVFVTVLEQMRFPEFWGFHIPRFALVALVFKRCFDGKRLDIFSGALLEFDVPIISSEFFDAGVQDIKPARSLLVDTESHDENIDRVKYKGSVYAIYRTYKMPTGRTQLYLTEKAGVR